VVPVGARGQELALPRLVCLARRDPEHGPDGLVFPDEEDSNWEWDEQAGQYFLHRFYKHQPDLNIGNPQVREEIRKIAGFWLESAFRASAWTPCRSCSRRTVATSASDFAPHDWLRDLRSFMVRRRGDAILMGEVNLNTRTSAASSATTAATN
jgi:hypothetical protein